MNDGCATSPLTVTPPAERRSLGGVIGGQVVQDAVELVVDIEVGTEGSSGESSGPPVVGREGEDEGDEGGEGDDDVHGRKSALV